MARQAAHETPTVPSVEPMATMPRSVSRAVLFELFELIS